MYDKIKQGQVKLKTIQNTIGHLVNPTENQIMQELLTSRLIYNYSGWFQKKSGRKIPSYIDHEDVEQEVLIQFYKDNKGKLTELYKNKVKFISYLINQLKWKIYRYDIDLKKIEETGISFVSTDEELDEFYQNREEQKQEEMKLSFNDAKRLVILSHHIYEWLKNKKEYSTQNQRELEWAHLLFFESDQLSWNCINCINDASEMVFLKFKRSIKEATSWLTDEEIELLHENLLIEKLRYALPDRPIQPQLSIKPIKPNDRPIRSERKKRTKKKNTDESATKETND